MAKGLKDKKGISAKQYLKKHPRPAILHFQPTEFVVAKTSAELREWEAMVVRQVGLVGMEGMEKDDVSYTGTKCGTPPIEYFDDCESD